MTSELDYYKQSSEILYLISKRVNERELYFKVSLSYSTIERKQVKSLHVQLNIEYQFIKNADGSLITCNGHNFDTWNLECMLGSCSLKNSVMIQPAFRSFGVGTYALHTIFALAKDHVPQYKAGGSLANNNHDELPDNFERRENLYKHIGFSIDNNKFSVNQVKNLNIRNKIDNIDIIDIGHVLAKTIEENYKTNNSFKQTQKRFEYFEKKSTEYQNKYFSLWRKYLLSCLSVAGLVWYKIYQWMQP